MPPELRGERILLRAPLPADVDARLALGRDPEIVRNLGGDPDTLPPFTRADAQRQHDQALADGSWAIEHAGRYIGSIRIHSIVDDDRRGQIALALWDAALLGRGLGPEAIRLVAGYAFRELGLHRLGARVLASNQRSLRALEKCGFVREGLERESALVGDSWQDDVLLGLVHHP